MIKLDSLFKSLALSVLNNTSVVTDNKLNVEPDKQEYILEFINEAVTRLHSRFILKTNTLYLEMREGRTNYPLLARYSYMNYDPAESEYPFIRDTPSHPFEEDVIKVLEVYDNLGRRRRLNDSNDPTGLFTPRPDTLQCIRPKHCEILSISYQARHPVIQLDEGNKQEIDVPDTLLPAVKYWVGYSYYTGLNTAETAGKASEYLQMYEAICKEVEDYDLANGSDCTTNGLFEKRGWL